MYGELTRIWKMTVIYFKVVYYPKGSLEVLMKPTKTSARIAVSLAKYISVERTMLLLH